MSQKLILIIPWVINASTPTTERAKIEKTKRFHKRPGGLLHQIPIKQLFIPERETSVKKGK